MNKVIYLLLIIGFNAGVSVSVEQQKQSEKYTSNIIIEAKWGSGEGEFGICSWGYGLAVPKSIFVDGKSIYILDSANLRINIYSLKGKYIRNIELQKQKELQKSNETVKDELRFKSRITNDYCLGGYENFVVDKRGYIYLCIGYSCPRFVDTQLSCSLT